MIKPGHYERSPTWVPVTQELIGALMGKDRETRLAEYRKLCGFVDPPKRKVMK